MGNRFNISPARLSLNSQNRIFINKLLWSPSQISPAAWFDANDISTIHTGVGVSQWDDKSGNGNNATQGIGTNQPQTGINTIGGLNTITFDGTDDRMTHPVLVSDPTELTMSFVAQYRSGSTLPSSVLWGHRSSPVQLIQMTYQRSAPSDLRLQARGSGNNIQQPEFEFDETNAHLAVGVFDKPNNNHVVYVNGTGGTPNTYNFGSETLIATINTIGSTNIGGTSWIAHFDGNLGEMVITTSALSTSDRQKLEGYFAWKWSLVNELPLGHPYKSAPPYA